LGFLLRDTLSAARLSNDTLIRLCEAVSANVR
jgi:hypothetical protein